MLPSLVRLDLSYNAITRIENLSVRNVVWLYGGVGVELMFGELMCGQGVELMCGQGVELMVVKGWTDVWSGQGVELMVVKGWS